MRLNEITTIEKEYAEFSRLLECVVKDFEYILDHDLDDGIPHIEKCIRTYTKIAEQYDDLSDEI